MLSIHTLFHGLRMKFHPPKIEVKTRLIIASKLGVGPPKKFANKIGIPSSNSRWLPYFPPELESLQVLGKERGDRSMDRDPFYRFGDKGWNAINSNHRCQVYSGQHSVHAELEKTNAS